MDLPKWSAVAGIVAVLISVVAYIVKTDTEVRTRLDDLEHDFDQHEEWHRAQ